MYEDTNNIFSYSPKELVQDAFLCWSINWLALNDSSSPLYQYGKDLLDLCLGDQKQEEYRDVLVKSQYKNADILVMFKDDRGNSHGLIIEDKTNTCDHHIQLKCYEEKIFGDSYNDDMYFINYPKPEIHLAYVKTGICYDDELRDMHGLRSRSGHKVTIVNIDGLLEVIARHHQTCSSEILSSYYQHILSITNHRKDMADRIQKLNYLSAMRDPYGQFYFLSYVFHDVHSNYGTLMHVPSADLEKDENIYVDRIFSGHNMDGSTWTQYRFWGDRYPNKLTDTYKYDYHYMYWRLDSQKGGPYLSLRHYDQNANINSKTKLRKQWVYDKLRMHADSEHEKYPGLFKKIGNRRNYKESDLLFIPMKNLEGKSLEDISKELLEIQSSMVAITNTLYDGLKEHLREAK